jgi:hypothetical protein
MMASPDIKVHVGQAFVDSQNRVCGPFETVHWDYGYILIDTAFVTHYADLYLAHGAHGHGRGDRTQVDSGSRPDPALPHLGSRRDQIDVYYRRSTPCERGGAPRSPSFECI